MEKVHNAPDQSQQRGLGVSGGSAHLEQCLLPQPYRAVLESRISARLSLPVLTASPGRKARVIVARSQTEESFRNTSTFLRLDQFRPAPLLSAPAIGSRPPNNNPAATHISPDPFVQPSSSTPMMSIPRMTPINKAAPTSRVLIQPGLHHLMLTRTISTTQGTAHPVL